MAMQVQGAVPRLRFPEFANLGAWKERRLGEVMSFQAGFPFASAKFSENNSGLRLVRNRDLKSNDKAIFYSGDFEDRYVVSDGDVLIGMDGDFTPYVWRSGRALLNQRVGRISAGQECSLDFAYYLLSVHLREIEDSTAKTTVKHLSHSDVESIKKPLPVLAEQKKVAGCLVSLDACIGSEIRKLDALKSHKQGLMQQLFPAEGRCLPRLRFPGFNGEWRVAKLSDVSIVVRGGSPRPIDSYLTHAADGLSWLKIGDVDKAAKYIERTQEKVIPAALSKTREVHPGDLILSNSMSFGRPYISKISCCIHDGWLAITDIGKQVNSNFLYYALGSQACQTYFLNAAAGSGVKNLNADIIKQLSVVIPMLEEQRRISECLSEIDEVIAFHSEKIASLQRHKAGLMQGLFPVTEVPVS
ncbi:restriction endonuclease subunit S [Xanthomonas translucens pv. translucens]|uniref:restriction endonuclease subunit S n=2 Tax=Xanthomonas campestris pv. translucens TaxID=343 RepID=UPI000AB9B9D5|nr:restriction endonuclease subunit S [Xanthomonas translucens]MCS3359763.1 restriction endonuclease subunit S [Xanthomonas translucens pv. translucens]MCS3373450.1 restriction endonuclease subunit S [Xanthomonas translucens pv. translucens]MCT8275121.1 restriction endonuclease subunit S [Xanthomonas translucens pv. translucens]MCT8278186.1 restriction endonuclease subunit S [Xanthomonas translucens pv. translucens]MCT8289290.1 restriction endonuclease subunit S [Xanthomonas translucens pv. tr